MSTVIARQVTKAATPIMLLASVNFFLQGHNLPGGGFIAGVMTSAAITLIYIIFNFEGLKQIFAKQERKKYDLVQKYIPLTGYGLLFAVFSGLISILLGLNFLDHRKGAIHIPLFEGIHWTTAVIFDLGVYIVVVGSLLTMIEVLGEE